VVKVLGRLLALARDANETRPATLWLLACLRSACLRHGHGRELVNEARQCRHWRQPGAGLAGLGGGGGRGIDESIGSAKGGRQTASKAETSPPLLGVLVFGFLLTFEVP